ncbi:MAG: hypothetical protein QW161_01550 [Candidatus Bathyarchaeia archaeon]
MLGAIIKRLKKLKSDKCGVSNVLVVMLSLILITVIVANVVLWNYQMNQLDIERMRESINITNASRITRSQWFTAKNEFSIITGSRISGFYTDTKAMDGFYESFREELPSARYNPSDYALGNSTRLVSGGVADLKTDNDVCMWFQSYPTTFSSITETFGNNVAGTLPRNTENTIVGSVFIPTKDGEAQSITIYVRVTSSSKNMKCAIYLHSNLSLIAQTEEKPVPVSTSASWVTFNFNEPKPVLRANTEYLLVAWAQSGSGYAYLYYTLGQSDQGHYVNQPYSANFPNILPNPIHEVRAYCIYCTFRPASEEKVEVEFSGASDPHLWMDLTWIINTCCTVENVAATFQLYNWQTGEYSTSGEGFQSSTIGTDEVNITQSISANPMAFKDAEGSWKMRITGTKATEAPFILKVDWIELKATLSNIYRLEITNIFVIDLLAYPLNYVYGVEIMVRYNVSEVAERWFIKAYDWSSESFSNAGFNVTEGDQPAPNEWNNYAISINENWTRYIRNDGTIQVMFCDEGTNGNQTFVHIDFVGVRVILNGLILEIKNSGATTAHMVSLWVINATHHMRYDADFFINSGESAVYIRVDIAPPAGNFIVKIVTERGNIDTF